MSYRARLRQDNQIVAQVWAEDKAEVEREIGHYARVYAQDGPVQIEITFVFDT